MAVKTDGLEVAKRLIENGANMDALNANRETPLFLAARYASTSKKRDVLDLLSVSFTENA